MGGQVQQPAQLVTRDFSFRVNRVGNDRIEFSVSGSNSHLHLLQMIRVQEFAGLGNGTTVPLDAQWVPGNSLYAPSRSAAAAHVGQWRVDAYRAERFAGEAAARAAEKLPYALNQAPPWYFAPLEAGDTSASWSTFDTPHDPDAAWVLRPGLVGPDRTWDAEAAVKNLAATTHQEVRALVGAQQFSTYVVDTTDAAHPRVRARVDWSMETRASVERALSDRWSHTLRIDDPVEARHLNAGHLEAFARDFPDHELVGAELADVQPKASAASGLHPVPGKTPDDLVALYLHPDVPLPAGSPDSPMALPLDGKALPAQKPDLDDDEAEQPDAPAAGAPAADGAGKSLVAGKAEPDVDDDVQPAPPAKSISFPKPDLDDDTPDTPQATEGTGGGEGSAVLHRAGEGEADAGGPGKALASGKPDLDDDEPEETAEPGAAAPEREADAPERPRTLALGKLDADDEVGSAIEKSARVVEHSQPSVVEGKSMAHVKPDLNDDEPHEQPAVEVPDDGD